MLWMPPRNAMVRASGAPVSVVVEQSADPARIDHVWIDLDCGPAGPLRASVNTFSRRNSLAGFDPRVRVGLARSAWQRLPERGLLPSPGLDYAMIESATNVFYETLDRREVELLLIEKASAAAHVEAWGQYHAGPRAGLHQIHSRRASCAVPEDLLGQDGAVKFYFERDGTAEMLLLKFCGQA